MAEYIEREALLNELQEEIDFETTMYTEEQTKWFKIGLKCAVRDVKYQPKVDLVELITCKDCIYYDITTFSVGYGWCKCLSKATWDDFYCGCAERID